MKLAARKMESTILSGKIKSAKGFYIGEVYGVISDDLFHQEKDGVLYDQGEAVGFGGYVQTVLVDYHSEEYSFFVASGYIYVVPLEFVVDEKMAAEVGHIFESPGTATVFESTDEFFNISLPNGEQISINTHEYTED